MELKKQIRVAQVIGHAGAGGVESCIMNYYKHIDKSKVQFDFLVENTCPIIDKELIESYGGKIIIIPSYKKLLTYIRVLKKIFIKGNYDIVHSNMNTLNVFTLKAAKKAGIKVRIAHSHSTSNKKEWKRNIIKNILRLFSKKYATHYFACSEHAGRWLFGNKTYDKGAVVIINNAIELDRFYFNQDNRDSIRNIYNINDKYVIGHVGRFTSQKNHSFLIDVFNEIQKKHDDSILFLVGDGPLLEKIKNKVKSFGIQDKVIFAGIHSDIEKYYSAMDLFLFPSIYEGLGMTFIEAQINGLKAYTSNYVPREAFIGEQSRSIELEVNKWVNQINDFGSYKRNVQGSVFSSYDIEKASKYLLELYFEFVSYKS